MKAVSSNIQRTNEDGPKVHLPLPNLHYSTETEVITLFNGKYPATCPHIGAAQSIAGHGDQETNILQAKKNNTIQTNHFYQACSSTCALFKCTKNNKKPTLEVQLGCSNIRHPEVQMFIDGGKSDNEKL
jgi:hypothetical protein